MIVLYYFKTCAMQILSVQLSFHSNKTVCTSPSLITAILRTFKLTSSVSPNTLSLSEQPNLQIPRGLRLHDVVLALGTISPKRFRSFLSINHRVGKVLVDPCYFILHFGFCGFVFCVHSGLLGTETGDTEAWSHDCDYVKVDGIGANGGADGLIARLDDFEFHLVLAFYVDV